MTTASMITTDAALAGIMRDILADPFEDAPRLVYADWLDERNEGDPRAEFIRVQCELAKIGPAWEPEEVESPIPCRHIGGGEYDLGHFDFPPPMGARVNAVSDWGKHAVGLRVNRSIAEADGTRFFAVRDQYSGKAAARQAAALRRRERELLFDNWPRWCLDLGLTGFTIRCGDDNEFSACRNHDEEAFRFSFRRGFVGSISLPLAAWVGGGCQECGYSHSPHHRRSAPGDVCLTCGLPLGSGYTPALGPLLVRAAPLESVRLTDREPWLVETGAASWWARQDDHDSGPTGHLPWRLFQCLRGGERFSPGERVQGRHPPDTWLYSHAYPTSDAARAALSRAGINWACGEHPGLEPISKIK